MDKSTEELIKKGKNALKKGLFKWSKDYVSAAINFDQASSNLKNKKLFKEAIEVYKMLIPVNEKMNDNWAVAKNYENIIICLFEKDKENISLDELFEYSEKAIDNFVIENSQNTLYMTLEKIATELAKLDKADKALEIHEKIHLYSIKFEEKVFRKDYMLHYLRLLIEENKFSKCVEVLSREIHFIREIDQSNLSSANLFILDLMLVYLITHNPQEIENARELTDSSEFRKSREREIFDNFYDLYLEGDQQGWEAYLNSSKLYCIMPNNLIKSLKKISVKKYKEEKDKKELEELIF
jgi:hypothetical protein